MLGSRTVSQEAGQLVASKYRLERPLARGGMGAVWVARHVELDVDVALKFRRFADDVELAVEHRFKREAQAAAQLRGPHIVHIHDYGVHEGTPYIAMELLSGEDLGQRLDREGAMSLTVALGWLRQAAKALRVVHAAGIVHRDIKPSNLFLAEQQGEAVLKMLDFGIAKTPDEGGATTSAGLLLGSPAYMSPEQARGQRVDARSDLWSLAAVLYRMLTGRAPFEGPSSGDILVRLCTEDVAPPSSAAPHLGPEVDRFFRRALARDPDGRFQDVDELLAAAETLAELPGASEVPSLASGGSACAEGRRTPSVQSSPRPVAGGAGRGRSTPTESLRMPLPVVEHTLSSERPSLAAASLVPPAPAPAAPAPAAPALSAQDRAAEEAAPDRGEEARRPLPNTRPWFSALGVGSVVALGVVVLWSRSEGPEPDPPLTSTSMSALSPPAHAHSADAHSADAASLTTGPSSPDVASLSSSVPAPPSPSAPTAPAARTEARDQRAPAVSSLRTPSRRAPSDTTSPGQPPARPPSERQTHEPTVTPPADPVFGLPLQERAPGAGTR